MCALIPIVESASHAGHGARGGGGDIGRTEFRDKNRKIDAMTMEPPEPVPAVAPLPPITAADDSLFMSPPSLPAIPMAVAPAAANIATSSASAAAVAATAAAVESGGCSLLWLIALVLALALLVTAVVLPALGMPNALTDWWLTAAAVPKKRRMTNVEDEDEDDDDVVRPGSARNAVPMDAAAAMNITGSSLTPSFVDPRRSSMSREAMRSSPFSSSSGDATSGEPRRGGAWSPSALSTAAGGGAGTEVGTSGITGLTHSGRDAVRADQPQRPAFFSWQASK
jgi:hypothetical protein